jgi:hypothetical protein
MKNNKRPLKKTSISSGLSRIKRYFEAQHQPIIVEDKGAFTVKDFLEGDPVNINLHFMNMPQFKSILVQVSSDRFYAFETQRELFHLVNHLDEHACIIKYPTDELSGSLQLTRLYSYREINSMEISHLIAEMVGDYVKSEAMVNKVANGKSVAEASDEPSGSETE